MPCKCGRVFTAPRQLNARPHFYVIMVNTPSNTFLLFYPQNNAGDADAEPGNEQPSTSKDERFEPNKSAAPVWDAARTHRAAEQKAKLRADSLTKLMKSDIIPIHFYGGDKLPGYFHPLSQKMADLIRKQGAARCKLAIAELRECQAQEKKRADSKTEMCRQIYADEGDENFTAAEEAIAKLVSRFRNTEIRRIEAVEKRETARHATTSLELSHQVCKVYDAHNLAPAARSRVKNAVDPRLPIAPTKGRNRQEKVLTRDTAGPPAALMVAKIGHSLAHLAAGGRIRLRTSKASQDPIPQRGKPRQNPAYQPRNYRTPWTSWPGLPSNSTINKLIAMNNPSCGRICDSLYMNMICK